MDRSRFQELMSEAFSTPQEFSQSGADLYKQWSDRVINNAIRSGARLTEGNGTIKFFNKKKCMFQTKEIKRYRKTTNKPWWDAGCTEAKVIKRAAFDNLKKHYSRLNLLEYRRIAEETRRRINKRKSQHFKKFISELNPTVRAKEFWSKINAFKKCAYLNPLEPPNEYKKSKIEDVVNTVASMWVNDSFPEMNHSEYNQLFESLFNLQEILIIIKNLKTDSSPGLDYINNPANTKLHVTCLLLVKTHVLYYYYIVEWEITTNRYVTCNLVFGGNGLLRILPLSAIESLLNIFNKIVQDGSYPADWRNIDVMLIPKPNKIDFRPISLSSCTLKIFEKLILKRIERLVEINNILPRSQFGFWKRKLCEDCISLLKHIELS
ncbi:uncharacterized protein LOC105835961 isoform X1 [Monomorium pharaonis]|uniref:uncharacterized protein LOC105835961 isoform X1 n=1 Tax=Monomorium pharaonis TaxID=307658 RepID=UPI0017460D4F|nr:uncharacterized protein LOC105835961 isoform X1 [Monomorium pharaonis]